jgi:phosphatidylglycerophosphatase A
VSGTGAAGSPNGLGVWVAQGFGVGRVPIAPGTFGSVLGVGWFALLVAADVPWGVVCGTLAGLGASVWLCGAAEKALGQTDPGSVVLDEIAAIPLCFTSWIGMFYSAHRSWPGLKEFFAGGHWWFTAAVLAAFRLFDVWKPWPVRQSQRLPGGWGVTVDDVLAAVYVNLAVLLVVAAKSFSAAH